MEIEIGIDMDMDFDGCIDCAYLEHQCQDCYEQARADNANDDRGFDY